MHTCCPHLSGPWTRLGNPCLLSDGVWCGCTTWNVFSEHAVALRQLQSYPFKTILQYPSPVPTSVFSVPRGSRPALRQRLWVSRASGGRSLRRQVNNQPSLLPCRRSIPRASSTARRKETSSITPDGQGRGRQWHLFLKLIDPRAHSLHFIC